MGTTRILYVLKLFFFSWEKEGIAHCMKADNAQSLPYDIRFSLTKTAEMTYISAKG